VTPFRKRRKVNTNDSPVELQKENDQKADKIPTASIVFIIPFIETFLIILLWSLAEGFSIYMLLVILPMIIVSFVGAAIGAAIGKAAVNTRGSVIFFAILFSLLALGLFYSLW
jgi:hypothetical protein